MTITLRSEIIFCTRVNATLTALRLMYVLALHSLTQVTAAASVSCLLVVCGPIERFTDSTNCFFLECLGEQGAPTSAFNISSNIRCEKDKEINHLRLIPDFHHHKPI